MGLANKSSVHNCGGNILSSILDIRQLNNIKHRERFCSGKVGQASACLLLTFAVLQKSKENRLKPVLLD
jgi:hypothetical protein